MQIYLTWTDFKVNVVNKSLLRFQERETFYLLQYNDFETDILKDSGADQTDFEANYKSSANKPVTVESAAFASKKLGTKSLFNRTSGATYAAASGANTFDYGITYAACKINGLEVIGAEIGDYVNLKVVHPTNGVVGQFGYNVYLAKDFYSRESKYDADLVSGLIIRIEYNSISAKNLYFNYLLHEVT